jgi:hypothetical protein
VSACREVSPALAQFCRLVLSIDLIDLIDLVDQLDQLDQFCRNRGRFAQLDAQPEAKNSMFAEAITFTIAANSEQHCESATCNPTDLTDL